MKIRTLVLAAISILAIVVSWLVGNHLPTRVRAQSTVGAVTVRPFTLKATLYSQGQVIDHITAGYRADGSNVMQRSLFPGKANEVSRYIQFSDGRNVRTMDSVGMVINYPAQSPQVMAGALLRRFNNSGSNCVSANQTFRGWDRILGERVAVITDDVEATKPHVVTLKTAPGLGCWILAYQSVDEEGNVIMEQKADSLVYEEPDPALFSVSSDYRADKPSVVMGAVYKHAGIVPDADDLKRWTDQDTRWAKGQ